jgi:hypothetical protein
VGGYLSSVGAWSCVLACSRACPVSVIEGSQAALPPSLCGVAVPATGGLAERNDYVRRCAAGAEVAGAPAAAAEVITRYAPAAVVMNDFYWDLFGKSRATPYPAADIKRAMAAIPDLADFAAQVDAACRIK